VRVGYGLSRGTPGLPVMITSGGEMATGVVTGFVVAVILVAMCGAGSGICKSILVK
jgi:hypothetical protein